MRYPRGYPILWILGGAVACLTALGFVYDFLYKTRESNVGAVRKSMHHSEIAKPVFLGETEQDVLGDVESNNNVTMVIIVAYHRSGSSLTGKMYDKDHDTFYSFEPLHRIYTKLVPFREQFERVGYHKKE